MASSDLNGRVAVVTGAASGIGAATARSLAKSGAEVVIVDAADGRELAAELGGCFIRADVSDEQQVASLMAAAAEATGRIDYCVNNAGIGTSAALIDTSADDLARNIGVNTGGTLYGIKHAAGFMEAGGAIVNTASLAAVIGLPGLAAYSASKAGVVALTRVAALELGPRGIRVNAVCPSSVDTPMLASQPGGDVEVAVTSGASALGTLLKPENVASVIEFLLTDASAGLTGQAIALDAGVTAGLSLGLIDAFASGIQQ